MEMSRGPNRYPLPLYLCLHDVHIEHIRFNGLIRNFKLIDENGVLEEILTIRREHSKMTSIKTFIFDLKPFPKTMKYILSAT